MESAILFESGAYKLVDRSVVVSCPDEIRIERVMQRDGISREKVLEWMNRQLPQEEVRRRADFEIINDGIADIDKQLNKILRNMQQTILAIAGKPGLYKLVSRGKNNLIVETLDAQHRRVPAFATDRITSLGDIAMFTETDDVPLMDVLDNLKKLEEGKKASINEKKATPDELKAYFTKVLPEWDRERVHTSDIKKLISWYNILVDNGITDFKETEKEETTEKASE
jgi:dephospho-CoA kinase